MELMDKSLGDLLRHLPMIIFEDSTLHPELPLLVWLMVAHSKSFELPLDLITKVLRVVFEVASCPWQDLETHQDETAQKPAAMLSIGSFHKAGSNNTPSSVSDTLIWSTLLRAHYGGMAGDIRMLRHFAEVWNERFSAGAVPKEIQLQLVSTKEIVANLRWCDLPTLIHQSSSLQSEARVAALTKDGILQLSMVDLSIEGIDFHCSPVLDNILADRELVETYLTRLSTFDDSLGSVPSAWDERRSWLEGILKRCVWKYSAGINRRRCLIPTVDVESAKVDALKPFWVDSLSPRTRAYAERYIKERI